MKKSKLIQTRLSDEEYSSLLERAASKGLSISEYVRNFLFTSKEEVIPHENANIIEEPTKKSVFERPEFIKTVIWIYSKKDDYDENNLNETKYHLSLINSFIMDLDPKYLDYFYVVKKDLEKIINEYSAYYRIKYQFVKSYNSLYFDYKKFEKMILEELL